MNEPTTANIFAGWTDDEVLDYCFHHSRTERALFHRDHIARLYELAGHKLSGALPEWIVVRPAIIDPLVKTARAKLAG